MILGLSRSRLKYIGDKIRHRKNLSNEEERDFAQYRIEHKHILYDFFTIHSQLISSPEWKNRRIVLAARLKKRATIESKLSSRLTEMNLSRMHDIVGCRLIFPDIDSLVLYRSKFIAGEHNRKYRRLEYSDRYDYIKAPRETGYRGIHDIFEEEGPLGIPAKIEVQYRTKIQHSWATALEVWDRHIGSGAKFGKEASEVQMFFRDVSELFWRYLDSSDHSTRLSISDLGLFNELLKIDNKHGIIKFFAGVRRTDGNVEVLESEERENEALLRAALDMNPSGPTAWIEDKAEDQLIKQLFEDELDKESNSVLVSVSGRSFAKAYNNYFDDVRRFRKNLSRAILRPALKDFPFWGRGIVKKLQERASVLRFEDQE